MKRITMSKTTEGRVLAIFHDQDGITDNLVEVLTDDNLNYLVGDIFGVGRLTDAQMEMVHDMLHGMASNNAQRG